MLKLENAVKYFDKKLIINDVSFELAPSSICGLIGSNGSGKSTLLRLMSGVYKLNGGKITLYNKDIFNDFHAREKVFFVSDDLYFHPGYTLSDSAKFYASLYKDFSMDKFNFLCKSFGLNTKQRVRTFSKGMKRQGITLLAVSANTDYILFDETFDGLDPVVRNNIKKLLYDQMCERNLSVLLTSHSLKEVEDSCDRLIFLHDGKVVMNHSTQDAQSSMVKIQIAFEGDWQNSKLDFINALKFTRYGTVATVTVMGDGTKEKEELLKMGAKICDILPLSLEEIFIAEMEAKGYFMGEIFERSDIND